MKVAFEGVPESLLIPLFVKAKSTKEGNKVNDPKSLEIFESIDYDFSQFEAGKATYNGVIARTVILDRETKKFLKQFPDAIIVSIGCGLDTRYTRLDNGQLEWYDLDVPEAIECKKKFFQESERYHFIAKSAWDFSWINDISANGRKVLFICEGVLMYFTEDEVAQLLNQIKEHFPGSYLMLELMSKFSAAHSSSHDTVSKIGLKFQWGVSYGEDVEKLCDGLKLIGYWNLSDEFPSYILGLIFRLINDTIGLYHFE